MHIEPRLLKFTKGVRWRIASAVAIGLLSVDLASPGSACSAG